MKWEKIFVNHIYHKQLTSKIYKGISLAVQWLRLRAPNAGVIGSISAWGTKIPQAAWCRLKTNKQIKYINNSHNLTKQTIQLNNGQRN